MSEVNPNHNPLSGVKDEDPVPYGIEEQLVYGKAVADESVRPWGHYDILFESDDCKVKKIQVNPGGKLSYQYHFKRNEVWCVASGTGIFTKDGINTICGPGDTLIIPTRAKHMIENTGKEPLIFIEVQRGSYFGEDDIVRISDVYGRG